MSVTITIAGNHAHARRAGLVTVTEYPCQCIDGFIPGSPADPDCPNCHGQAVVRFDCFPFELNVSNQNFRTLWNALGLAVDYCGAIDGRIVSRAVRVTPAEFIQRSPTEQGKPGRVRVIDMGIGLEQATRYLTALAAIAAEAESREEMVVWG